ncbi:YckD family protein [Patescibacteria group bacterium]|nr:YckD family protein [Patescibacteria group bacterium]
MKKTAIMVTSLVLGLGLVYTALAAGPTNSYKNNQAGFGRQNMLDSKAKILGLTSDELKTKLDSGLNFQQIAEQQNISLADWQAKIKANHQEKLQKMVSAGIITQDQADSRLQQMAERQNNHPNNQPFNKGANRGLHFGRGMSLGLNR